MINVLLSMTIAAAVYVGSSIATAPVHTTPKTRPAPTRATAEQGKLYRRATRDKAKLPRNWIWQKRSKDFDSMYRTRR